MNRVGGLNWQNYIKKPDGITDTVKLEYNTQDIQDLIIYADELNYKKRIVKDLAVLLRGCNDTETLKNIWQFVRTNIKYVADSVNNDSVQSANALLFKGIGDCKSMTLISAAFCRELKIPYKFRFTGYDGSKRIKHVYLIAWADNKIIPVDCVYWKFGYEVPFTYREDYEITKFPPGINGTGTVTTTNTEPTNSNFFGNATKFFVGYLILKAFSK